MFDDLNLLSVTNMQKKIKNQEGGKNLFSALYIYIYIYTYIYIYIYTQSWSELLEPLVNMIKEGSENKPALLILLIFYLKKITKIEPFIELKQLKMGENLIMK